jgi:hypothetical protein
MNSRKVLYSESPNDECYTPKYGVKPILKYIPSNAIIWCPFDKEDSEFVKEISKTNIVVYSHIDDGEDFFKYEPEKWDIIISNPPFKNKRKFFERALSFNKPFALLMTNTWLNDKYSKFVFYEANKDMQLLMFDKRIKFTKNNKVENKITFSSSYFCYDFLPKQIIIEKLEETNE